MKELKLNKYGFYELKNKPSPKELKEYYSKKYYQNNEKGYQKNYSKEEIQYFNNKIQQKYHLVKDKIKEKSLLDIGCGEGFTLSYFKKKNWNVTGIDYSDFGIKQNNPEVLENVIINDIFTILKQLIKFNYKYDLIWLDNILEHVLDPLKFLKYCHKLSNGCLIVEVPNDNSIIQKTIKKLYSIDDYWIHYPDHISYFNKQGLINICREAKWKNIKTISDFPIDFNIFNPDSNYILDKNKGKNCYKQKILIENLLHSISIEKTNEFYEKLCNLGIGRQIIGVFKNE